MISRIGVAITVSSKIPKKCTKNTAYRVRCKTTKEANDDGCVVLVSSFNC